MNSGGRKFSLAKFSPMILKTKTDEEHAADLTVDSCVEEEKSSKATQLHSNRNKSISKFKKRQISVVNEDEETSALSEGECKGILPLMGLKSTTFAASLLMQKPDAGKSPKYILLGES